MEISSAFKENSLIGNEDQHLFIGKGASPARKVCALLQEDPSCIRCQPLASPLNGTLDQPSSISEPLYSHVECGPTPRFQARLLRIQIGASPGGVHSFHTPGAESSTGTHPDRQTDRQTTMSSDDTSQKETARSQLWSTGIGALT